MAQQPISNNSQIINFILTRLHNNWETIFNSAHSLLSAINTNGFDFVLVNQAANPNIMQIIELLHKTNKVISAFEALLPHVSATPEQIFEFERVLLNSRQTVLQMEMIMLAMQQGDVDECLRLQRNLETQACL